MQQQSEQVARLSSSCVFYVHRSVVRGDGEGGDGGREEGRVRGREQERDRRGEAVVGAFKSLPAGGGSHDSERKVGG